MDIAAGDTVAANDDDAVNAVAPSSSTKGEDTNVGALVAFEGASIGAFTERAVAANIALLRCCQRRIVVCCKSNDDTTKARRYRFLKQREERKTYPLPGTKEFPNSSGRQG